MCEFERRGLPSLSKSHNVLPKNDYNDVTQLRMNLIRKSDLGRNIYMHSEAKIKKDRTWQCQKLNSMSSQNNTQTGFETRFFIHGVLANTTCNRHVMKIIPLVIWIGQNEVAIKL